MKIREALERAALAGKTVSSEKLDIHQQDLDSIGYWLVGDPDTSDENKIKRLKAILKANDWEVYED